MKCNFLIEESSQIYKSGYLRGCAGRTLVKDSINDGRKVFTQQMYLSLTQFNQWSQLSIQGRDTHKSLKYE